jgi:phage terminase Nu1 subunit (DNA packaging protein)
MVQQRKQQPEALLSLRQLAEAFGYATMTLQRKLRAAGVDTAKGATIQQVHEILMGSLEAERIRETRARADLLEMERREKERDLVPLAEVDEMIRNTHLPVRQRLMALPSEMCSRCNPSDPQLAREALDRWVTDSLPKLRAAIEKVKTS